LTLFAHTQRVGVGVRPWVAPTRGEETQSNRHGSEDSTHGSQPVTVLDLARPLLRGGLLSFSGEPESQQERAFALVSYARSTYIAQKGTLIR
jgi:hypothetical protein